MTKRFFVRTKGDALNCVAWDKSHPDLQFAVFDSTVGWGQLIALFIKEEDAEKYAGFLNLFDTK